MKVKNIFYCFLIKLFFRSSWTKHYQNIGEFHLRNFPKFYWSWPIFKGHMTIYSWTWKNFKWQYLRNFSRYSFVLQDCKLQGKLLSFLLRKSAIFCFEHIEILDLIKTIECIVLQELWKFQGSRLYRKLPKRYTQLWKEGFQNIQNGSWTKAILVLEILAIWFKVKFCQEIFILADNML